MGYARHGMCSNDTPGTWTISCMSLAIGQPMPLHNWGGHGCHLPLQPPPFGSCRSGGIVQLHGAHSHRMPCRLEILPRTDGEEELFVVVVHPVKPSEVRVGWIFASFRLH